MNALMRFAIVLVLSMGACTLLAQSLGEVARENRNTPHPRAKKVVTNDEIPSVDTLSTVPSSARDKSGSEKAAKGAAPESADALAKKDAEWNQKFSQQQEKITLLERELKVSEQEARQKQLAHIADVNARVNNQQQYAEAEKLDQDDLAQKREKLNAERQKLESMQEDARHAGVKLPD
jgi:chromosome segregation ATPase